ncbi:MAG: MBL fold metallo-hydrolase [Candidatus Hodarchaeota archaeon]
MKEWVPGVIGFIDSYDRGGAALGTYVIEGSDNSYAIIDPSTKKAAQQVLDFWNRTSQPKELAYIILTHAHLDHYGGVPFLKKKVPSAQLVVHEKGASILQEGKQALRERFPYSEKGRFKKKGLELSPDLEVKEETLELGDKQLLLQESGGHCEDHLLVMAISKDTNALFLGDETPIYPNNPYSFFMDSTGDYEKHQKTLKLLENVSAEVVLPAHIPPIFNQGSDLFEAAQEMRFSLDHVKKTIFDTLMEKGGEKEWFIQERVFKTLKDFHWYEPYFSWGVGPNTIHRILKNLEVEGEARFDTAKQRWVPE